MGAPDPVVAYVTIAVLAAVTLGTRLGGAAVMRLVPISDRVTRFLEAMSVSVLAAIVVTFLAQGGARELVAVATAVGLMVMARSPVWAMVSAMAAAALWTLIAG